MLGVGAGAGRAVESMEPGIARERNEKGGGRMHHVKIAEQ